MRRPGNTLQITAIIGLALLTNGCKKSNQYAPPPAPKVSVAKPAAQKITRYLDDHDWDGFVKYLL